MDENLNLGSGKEKKTIKADGGKRLEKGCAWVELQFAPAYT